MERLVKPVSDGGAPYLNQDFFQFLQQNHLSSYGAFLEEINDKTTGDCGIIIKGLQQSYSITIEQDPIRGEDIEIKTSFFDLTDSLVYLDGDFLEPAPWIATQSQFFDLNIDYYIYKVSLPKLRRYTKVYDYSTDVIEENYFDIYQTKPTTGNYITLNSIPGKNEGGGSIATNVSYLNFLKQDHRTPRETERDDNGIYYDLRQTTRRLSRVLRYYLAEEGELYMTYDVVNFTANGIGYGEMFGFKLINFDPNYQNLVGRYAIGYATGSSVTPQNLTTDTNNLEKDKPTITNYQKLGNLGGVEETFVIGEQLPPHIHGSSNGPATLNTNGTIVPNEMKHSHWLPVWGAPLTNFSTGGPKEARFTFQIPTISSSLPFRSTLFFKNNKNKIGEVFPGSNALFLNRDFVSFVKSSAISTFRSRQSASGPPNPNNGRYCFKVLIPENFISLPDGPFSGQTYEVDSDSVALIPPQTKDITDHKHPISSTLDTTAQHTVTSPHDNIPPTVNVAYYVKYNPY